MLNPQKYLSESYMITECTTLLSTFVSLPEKIGQASMFDMYYKYTRVPPPTRHRFRQVTIQPRFWILQE